ncbi:MAG TPA: transposase [Sphingomonas sp.]
MDRERWRTVLVAVRRAARAVGWNGGRRRPVYGNALIVALYMWSVWHDRPLCWASQREHYSRLFRPRRLPSVSQFTRRIKSDDCQRILQLVHDAFAGGRQLTDVAYLDGKPLPVSPVSKDPDATRGKVSGGFARGYKLHALVNRRRRIVAWSVMGLNVDEKTVARDALLPRLPPLAPDALVLADSTYDSAPLHAALATQAEVRLIHPLRGQHRAGGIRRAAKLRQMPATRRALVHAWEEHPALTRLVMKARNEIERVFGTLTCTAGGLAGLPAWVRTLARVRRWVGVKIILYNVRLAVREQLHKAAVG